MQERIAGILRQSARVHEEAAATLCEKIERAARMIIEALQQGGKVAFCGNGGSAADAQHLASELIGQFQIDERRPLPAIALTTDSSTLTSLSNDFGYRHVFSKQVEALLQPGDVLVALTTSGNSPNCLEAVKTAHEKDVCTIALTGAGGGAIADVVDLCIAVPASQTARIQETHITIGHILCELIEEALCGSA